MGIIQVSEIELGELALGMGPVFSKESQSTVFSEWLYVFPIPFDNVYTLG